MFVIYNQGGILYTTYKLLPFRVTVT